MLGKIGKINEICKSRKCRITFLGFLILCAIIVGYNTIPYPYVHDTPDSVYKVSFNAPFTLHFSQMMDKKSVQNSFKIQPKIKGEFIWRDNKTLEFQPSSYLEIGDNYRITIGAQASNIYKKSFGANVTLNFLVTGPPFVKFISPYFPIEEQIDEPIDSPSTASQSVPIVSSDQIVTIMFDRPMEWPSPNQLAMGENLLLIDPPVSGKYRFLGMSAFQFIPDSWPIGTRFRLKVPAGIPARDGGETEEEISWTIETSPLLVTKTSPKTGNENVDINSPIEVHFNQVMDLEQIRPGVNVLLYPSNDIDSGENPKYDGFFNTEVVYGEDAEGKQDKTVLVFKPTFPYVSKTEYRFVIKAGISSPSVSLGMPKDFELIFKTESAPGVKEFTPPSDENSSIFITFNTPMTVEEIIKGLSFAPELAVPPGIILNKDNTQAEIACQFNPNTNYTFSIKSGIFDAAGEEIKNSFQQTFKSSSIQSKLKWEDSNNFDFFNQTNTPIFSVRSKNANELVLQLCQVSDQNFIKTNSGQSWANYKCYSQPYVYNLTSDESKTTSLDLTEIFDEDWDQGTYFFSVESDNAQQIFRYFFVTDTVLVLKKSANSLLIWAKDAATGKPVSRMEIAVYDYNGEEIARGVTDGDGIYKVTRELGEGIYAIGKKNLEDENRWALSYEYWSIPTESKDGYEWIMPGESRIFLTPDKNTVFPGGEINIKGIWRIDNDAQLILTEEKQIKLTLQNEEKIGLFEEMISLRRNGSFDAILKVPPDISSGSYDLTVYDSQNRSLSSNPISIKVLKETPSFYMQWVNPQTDLTPGHITSFNLKANYEIGIPAASLRGRWELYKKPYYFNKYSDSAYYSYGDVADLLCSKNACISEEEWLGAGEFIFDQNGSTQIILTDAEGNLKPGYEYKLVATVESIDNKQVTEEINFKVHPADFYIGLSLKHYVLKPGDDIEGSLVAVDYNGDLIKDERIKLSLLQIENGKEGKNWYEKILSTDNEPKGISIPVISKMPDGIYKLKAEGQNNNFAELELYITSDERTKLSDDFEIFFDQPEYFVGGKAYLLINYPNIASDKPLNALITYERGGILGYQVVDLNQQVKPIEIPITEEMTPNMHVSAIIINNTDYPKAEIANTQLLVNKKDREIKISITPSPSNPAPGEDVTLKIHTYDYQNRSVQSVVALNIIKKHYGQSDPQLNPYDYFYKPRISQIFTSSNIALHKNTFVFDQPVMLPKEYTGTQEIDYSAYFNPIVLTDENGYAEVQLTLPDEYLTWQVNAMATSEAKNFGNLSFDLPVKKQLILNPIVPAFVIPGDEIAVSILAKNLSDEDFESKIELIADGINITGSNKQSVYIKSGMTEKLNWNIKVAPPENAKTLKFQFQSNHDSTEIETPIKYFQISESMGGGGLLEDRWSSKIRIPENTTPGMGGLSVSIAGTPVNILQKHINAVKNQDYVSTEQLATQLITDVILSKIGSEQEYNDQIQKLVTDVLSRQKTDGGYALWPGAESNAWLTAYVLLALNEADVTGMSKNSAVQFIWNKLDKSDSITISERFFILWALSEIGQYDTRSTITAFQSREESSIAGKAFLLMNLHNLLNAGQNSVYSYLQNLQSEITDSRTDYEEWTYFEESINSAMDTNIRSTAVVLLALAKLADDNPLTISITKYLTALSNQILNRFNSQENIWIIMALYELTKQQQSISLNYTAKIHANEKVILDENIENDNINQVYNAFIPIDSLKGPDGINEIIVEKDGVGPLYFNADLKYFPKNNTITSVEKGVIVTRNYYTLDDYAESQPLAEMEAGNLYRGVLTLIIPEDIDYIMVEENLPAGLKGLSFNPAVASLSSRYEQNKMIEEQGLNWIKNPLWNFEYYEIRDDKLLLFAEHLPTGVYKIDYLVQGGLPGKYNHLPASISQIFNPSVYARTEGEWIEIK